MSLRSALMVVSLLGLVSLAAAIIVPDPPVVSSNAACPNNVCVVTDTSAVYQFNCTSPNTTTTIVYWNLGGYQVVDITEFSALKVTFTATAAPRSASTLAVVYSELVIIISGTDVLFNTFNASTFTISCISIIDNVNINSAPEILFVDQAAPPSLPYVAAPTWDVTDCTAGGALMVKLSYQVEGPAANFFTYTPSLTGSGNTCTVMEVGSELTVLCEVENAADLMATLRVCADSDCRDFSAPITGVTCCTGELDVCTDDVSCTCLPGAKQRGWGCERRGDYSIDTYDGPQEAGQNSSLDKTYTTFPCPGVTPTPTPTPTPSTDEDPDPLALILVVILCTLAGVAAGLVLALVLSYCFFKKS